MGKMEKPRPKPLGASQGFSPFSSFTNIISLNRPVIPLVNLVIIPQRRLRRTVLIIKDGPHFRVQSCMPSCIQSFTGVKKRLLSYQLIHLKFWLGWKFVQTHFGFFWLLKSLKISSVRYFVEIYSRIEFLKYQNHYKYL